MIKNIEKTDLVDIFNMHKDNFIDHWNLKMLEESFNQKTFLGGEEIIDNKVACTVIFSKIFDEAELLSVVTEKSFRNKGLAYNLLKVYLEKLLEMGVKKVFLEVRQSNINAIKLYDKLGFYRVNERKKYYGEETAVVMLKEF